MTKASGLAHTLEDVRNQRRFPGESLFVRPMISKNRQRKQSLCRFFVSANFPLRTTEKLRQLFLSCPNNFEPSQMKQLFFRFIQYGLYNRLYYLRHSIKSQIIGMNLIDGAEFAVMFTVKTFSVNEVDIFIPCFKCILICC